MIMFLIPNSETWASTPKPRKRYQDTRKGGGGCRRWGLNSKDQLGCDSFTAIAIDGR
jgi:hypothetical protein